MNSAASVTKDSFYSAAYSGPNQMMIASMMYAVILFLTDKDLVVPGMIFLHMAAFGTAAVYRIYAWLGGMQEQNESGKNQNIQQMHLNGFITRRTSNPAAGYNILIDLVIIARCCQIQQHKHTSENNHA